jgi:hypothetical protein
MPKQISTENWEGRVATGERVINALVNRNVRRWLFLATAEANSNTSS